jgi:hypothetical protein
MTRRITTILVRVLAILSAGAFALVVAAWVRGYFISDTLGWGFAANASGGRHVAGAASGRGGVTFFVIDVRAQVSLLGGFWQCEPPGYGGDFGRVQARWSLLGLRAVSPSARSAESERIWALVAPSWLVALIAGTLPTISLARLRLLRWTRRASVGVCRRCGYDLRATPERCPECGTPAPAAR